MRMVKDIRPKGKLADLGLNEAELLQFYKIHVAYSYANSNLESRMNTVSSWLTSEGEKAREVNRPDPTRALAKRLEAEAGEKVKAALLLRPYATDQNSFDKQHHEISMQARQFVLANLS